MQVALEPTDEANRFVAACSFLIITFLILEINDIVGFNKWVPIRV